ncbi:MAG: TrpB-like pyridoxal phosphate-dependent enzyme [Clostridia bacterium]
MENNKEITKKIPYKIYLEEDEMPKQWLNMKAFMPEQHDPFLNPATLQPITAADLEKVFCSDLVEQELNCTDKYIDIPQEIQDFLKLYRPSPLVRAYQLEKELDTPAEIYYKFEGNNTSGSHKLNSAVAQAYYAKKQGLTCLTTETGAGQWGTALAMACGFYGLKLQVFMVKCSAQQKPHRKALIETYGGTVEESPSMSTAVGRRINKEFPNTSGSLGCAISEAIEVATNTPNCRYVLGSVLDHVSLHQSIIGLEAKTALDKFGVEPDMIIGCAGGGSNLAGLIAPFMAERLQGKNDIQFVAVEPASCPSLTRGRYLYDFGDTGKMTPLMRMYTLGSGYIPAANHAGGLRFHGMSPILSKLYHDGYMTARAVEQTAVFEAAVRFARCEGTLPAPESAHAIKVAIDEALKCKETGEKKKILFGLSGTGYFDMTAYGNFIHGNMGDFIPSDADLEKGFASCPQTNL